MGKTKPNQTVQQSRTTRNGFVIREGERGTFPPEPGGHSRYRSKAVAAKVAAWQAKFLAALAQNPNVSAAAEAAGRNRFYVYKERKNNPEFAAAWDNALNQAIDAAEGELYRRAVDGVEEPVFYQGEVVATVTKYDTTALIFLLKNRRPEVYADKVRHQHGWQDSVLKLLAEGRITPHQLAEQIRALGLHDDPEARMLLERVSTTTYMDEQGTVHEAAVESVVDAGDDAGDDAVS